MPPQSRGQLLSNLQSKSTPNLSTLNSLAEDSTLSPTSSIASAARHNHASSLATPKAHDSTTEQNDPSLLEDAFIEGITPETLSNDSASSSDDDDEDLPIPNLPPQRPLYTHHSRSHSHLLDKPSAPFAPPFYNRPPTPLPPSPSLTSLLRPAFTSRPTTPDSSDHEGPSTSSTHLPRNPHPPGTSGTATPASSTTTTTAGAGVASSSTAATFVSLAPTHGVPRAHPPVPTYEYYGFVLYLCSSAAFIGYLLWAYLPSALLHQLGIRYYPNRWWALALPAWGVVALVFVYVVLACWNTEVLTLKVESVEGMVDEAAMVAVVDEQGRIVRGGRERRKGGEKEREREAEGERSGAVKEGGRGKGGRRRANAGEAGDEKGKGKLKGDGSGDLDWRGLWSEGTDAVMDVPIGGVCEVLYGEGREN